MSGVSRGVQSMILRALAGAEFLFELRNLVSDAALNPVIAENSVPRRFRYGALDSEFVNANLRFGSWKQSRSGGYSILEFSL